MAHSEHHQMYSTVSEYRGQSMFNLKAWTMDRIETANVEASAHDIAQRLCDTINRKWRNQFAGLRHTLSVESDGAKYDRIVIHTVYKGLRMKNSTTWGYVDTATGDLIQAGVRGARGAVRFNLRDAVGYTDALTHASKGHDFIARKQPVFAYSV